MPAEDISIMTPEEAYLLDHPEHELRPPEVFGCDGRSGEDADLLDPDELAALAERVDQPEARNAADLPVRYAPCVRTHKMVAPAPALRSGDLVRRDAPAAFSDLAALQGLLLRSELTNEQTWPWCTIGKVFVGRDNDFSNWMWSGSGVLVGPNLLLTASHVAPWNFSSWWMRFVPAYRSGPTAQFGMSYVQEYRGVRNVDRVTGLDYVICKLYDRLGERAGWMGSYGWSSDTPYYQGRWTSVGYPGNAKSGQVPMVESDIRLQDVDDEGARGKELESHVFASSGWSGGPWWGWVDGQPRVVGVQSGTEEEFSFWDFFTATHSVGAGGLHLVDLVKYGWSNWA